MPDNVMRLHDLDEVDSDLDGTRRSKHGRSAADYYAEVEIGNHLGRLGLTGSGDLAGIEFNERALRTMSPAKVGEYLVVAYQAAIDQARQRFADDRRRNHR